VKVNFLRTMNVTVADPGVQYDRTLKSA